MFKEGIVFSKVSFINCEVFQVSYDTFTEGNTTDVVETTYLMTSVVPQSYWMSPMSLLDFIGLNLHARICFEASLTGFW